MMNKEQKKNYITEMTNQFENSKAVMVTHYQGLTMPQLDELRSKMREHGIVFKITKNRITKLALEKTKCKDLSNLFTGPTAVAFGEDAIMSARILSKFAKDNENLKLIGGIMENEVLDQAGVMNVANLPTLDEARANIVGILNASASKLVSILLARSEKMSNLPVENSENQPKERNFPSESKLMYKAASGSIEYLNIFEVSNINSTLKNLKDKNFWVYGFDSEGNKDLTNIEWKGNNILLFGSEGTGMHFHTSKYADFLIKININEKIESLNISNSAAIAFHHLNYQKKS